MERECTRGVAVFRPSVTSFAPAGTVLPLLFLALPAIRRAIPDWFAPPHSGSAALSKHGVQARNDRRLTTTRQRHRHRRSIEGHHALPGGCGLSERRLTDCASHAAEGAIGRTALS